MPGYRGHLLGGSIAYLIVLQCLIIYKPDVSIAIQGLLFCLIGSLFPDIDIKSKGQKYFYIALTGCLCFCLLYGCFDWYVALSLVSMLPLLIRHRGLFHSLVFIVVLASCSIFLALFYRVQYEALAVSNAFFFVVGAWSHIILDRFSTKIKRTFKKRR